MTDAGQTWRQFGTGPLSRVAAYVHILLVVELLLLVTTLPGLAPLLLLDRDVSNLPLVAVGLLPVGPAVCAALYALRHQPPDLTDLRPAAVFWRGYRASLAGVLRIWAPALLWLTVIAVNLAHLDAAAVPSWWAVPLLGVGALVALCTAQALVVIALFTFRTRDILRLAPHLLVRSPSATVGNLLLLAAATGITAVFSEAVLALFGSLLVLAFLRINEPVIDTVREEFTGE
ncbi:DUF624 domain-containing protein [Micromonospora sp. KC213]|uniref:DUF624 domain-containing protein n=1 Tax=Micromonospora sp. KC213 TaxID=2530378 RepID=UPI001044AC23|nr:DUF624 domain-containing protein [Micromonospora sp. KC213]TDC33755.1 DUF624 domain-containing protein [Micromonospora sp. KC213]